MEPTEQLSYILPTLCSVVDRIQDQQLDDSTPCEQFTVHDVLNHMIVGGTTFAYLFRGETPPETIAPGAAGHNPAAEFRKAMDDLLDAVKSPGALDRTITSPVGKMPGSTGARFIAFDGLVHGWDLATATGQRFEVPPAVIASVDGFARTALSPEMRDGDTFKDETLAPPNANALEQLVAFSGRSL